MNDNFDHNEQDDKVINIPSEEGNQLKEIMQSTQEDNLNSLTEEDFPPHENTQDEHTQSEEYIPVEENAMTGENEPRTSGTYEYFAAMPRRKSSIKTYVSLVLATSVVTSALVGGGLYLKFSDELESQNAMIQKAGIVSNIGKTSNGSLNSGSILNTSYSSGSTITQIAKKVGPSVVGIRMTISNPQDSFFGNSSDRSAAEGSGIIISKDGYIMTNYHVVSYADPKSQAGANTTLEVFLPDKRQAKAKFIGGDSRTDLAVIKIDLDNLPVAELGDSSKLEVGDMAVAIGNPLGMEFAGSVTTGVISALNRAVQSENDVSQNLIQTDAAINPGNSGGALVNSQGQVIGINSSKIAETGVEGLGFAIPINDAKPIINQLIMYGYVKGRPLIGISGRDISNTIAQQYNMPVGVYVMDVSQESGADNAGIKKGDIVVGLAGKTVTSMQDMNNIKQSYKAGDSVNITIYRNGAKQNLKLTFSEER